MGGQFRLLFRQNSLSLLFPAGVSLAVPSPTFNELSGVFPAQGLDSFLVTEAEIFMRFLYLLLSLL
jgi:hypothetical protein